MTHKDHIHAASLDDFYMYTVRENESEVLYSLFFQKEDGIDFMGTYAPDELKKVTPRETYGFDMKIIFLYLKHKIVLQVDGKSDMSQGNHFNHPSTDKKTFEDKFRERIDKTKEVPIKTLLWLDDLRNPHSEEHIHKMPPGYYIKVWVKNYEEFVQHIKKHGLPDVVSFDHDLAREHCVPVSLWDDYQASKEYQESQTYTEKTGLDCAEWLVNFCKENNLNLPEWYVHSDNPVGADKIEFTLKTKDESTLKLTTKEEREAEGLPEQDTYETDLMDGKKSEQEDQKQPRFRISLEANNGGY